MLLNVLQHRYQWSRVQRLNVRKATLLDCYRADGHIIQYGTGSLLLRGWFQNLWHNLGGPACMNFGIADFTFFIRSNLI